MQASGSGREVAEKRRLAVTLSGRGGKELADLARAAGWEVALWPGLVFVPTGQGLTAQQLQAEWVVVTSPQGAASLMSALDAAGLGVRGLDRVKLAALGSGTARALCAGGRAPDFLPSRADALTLAAELPAEPGACALHVTGEQGRDALQRGLTTRGVLYRCARLYLSQAPQHPPEARRDFLRADWVVVASGVAAQGLAQQVGTGLPLLAMGAQTAEAARNAGFARVEQAADPSVRGVMAALNRICPEPGGANGGGPEG